MTTIFIKDAAITSIGPDRSRNIVLSSSHFSLAWSIRDRQAGGSRDWAYLARWTVFLKPNLLPAGNCRYGAPAFLSLEVH
jgi:hypothetical protein